MIFAQFMSTLNNKAAVYFINSYPCTGTYTEYATASKFSIRENNTERLRKILK